MDASFFTRVLDVLELTRRWGLLCACCKELRILGKKNLRCIQSSRRLHQARERVTMTMTSLNDGGRAINVAECDDLPWLVAQMSFCQRKLAQELRGKARYLWVVPWLIVLADDPEEARKCAEQLRALNLGTCGTLEKWMHEALLESLDVTA
jgi:hypothetical protein